MFSRSLVGCVAAGVLFAGVLRAQAPDENAAAEAVRKAGGELKLDEKAADKHVEGVVFKGKKSSPDGLPHLAAFKQLWWVSLGTPKFGDGCLKDVQKLPLRSLKLDSSAVTDAGLKAVGEMTGLEYLTFRKTAVTDEGLAALKGLKKLRYLDASETKVTDAGVKGLTGLKALETVYLIGTDVSDAGLAELKALPALKSVNVTGAKRVTKAGAADLEKSRPGLSVVGKFK
jgi:internalin A